ncbi:NADH-ubiquinone oxidoreductase-F iron-sulfur binding region domain-containing protein [Phycicoccus ginsengisoli]
MSLIAQLDAAGLTGRGGGAFPTATKIRAAHQHRASLIVNACDGELGAAKDAFVVEHHLDELVRGARAVAGKRVRFAAHRDSATLARLRAARLPVLEVPHRYVSSEESSLISLAHGGLARPMTKRAPFVGGGVDSAGRRIAPTVVLNAETLWRVAQVLDHGAEWFRLHGTAAEPGPRLVTVSGAVHRPGVVETAAGVRLADLVEAAGGPLPEGPVVVGGLGGVLLSAGEALSLRWSREDLLPYGTTTGPGVVHVLDPGECPVHEVARWLRYAAGESAGQCGPCMFGVPALAGDWEVLAAGAPSRSWDAALDRVGRRADLLRGRGACRFPDGVAGFAASAVRVLADHLEEHATGRCSTSAGVAA